MTELVSAVAHWCEHGFLVLPGMLSVQDLSPGRSELGTLFPTPEEFHGGVDPSRNARFRSDEYGGLVTFPFASVELSLIAVHPRMVDLARLLLKTDDIRIYSAEAWAKFTGAFDYEQEHHRDFLKHSILHNVEMFLFLDDVTEGLGPTHLVSTTLTGHVPLVHRSASRSEYPQLYEAEVSAAGPAGTVLAYRGETLHRATNLTAQAGARYALHCGFRPAAEGWIGCQEDWSFDPSWNPFVARATPQQLELFGFPTAGHPFSPPRSSPSRAIEVPRFLPGGRGVLQPTKLAFSRLMTSAWRHAMRH